MTDSEQLAFMKRVMKAFEPDNCDNLYWMTEEDGTIRFYILCSDLFYWGCADSEDITPKNIELLEQTFRECQDVCGDFGTIYADCLFCCRFRKMRPQKPCYKNYPEKFKPLFDACGPERTE